MVYGFRDVQGYDSLFAGQYKAFANQFAVPRQMGDAVVRDASPPEVGNMVFFQDPNAPLVPLTGATLCITLPPDRVLPGAMPPGSPLYTAERELSVYALPDSRSRAWLAPSLPARRRNGSGWPDARLVTCRCPGPTVLNLADQYFPGWKATVDDRTVPIARQQPANVFRTVPVPAGRHVIRFQ